MTRKFLLGVAMVLAYACLLNGCTDPVAPEFQLTDGYLLVDGQITDRPGESLVTINRNELLFGNAQLVPQLNATVQSEDESGQLTTWSPTSNQGQYAPPAGWAGSTGTSYRLLITTVEGEIIRSIPEKIPPSVPFSDLRVEFEQESYFSEARDRFVPAFKVLVNVDDPDGEPNFYQWRTETFQTIDVCAMCSRSVYRNGECIATPGSRFADRYDYLCGTRCWVTSQATGTNLLSDEFSDGQLINGIVAASSDFDRPGRLLFVIKQYNLTKSAYEFSALIRTLTEGSGGLNAPLPAALIGNLTDESESETPVLGYVSASSVITERVMIQRDTFGGVSLPFDNSILLEPLIPSPPSAPCIGPGRTSVEPEGWID